MTSPDEQAVKQAVAGFHAALKAMFAGDAGAMADVWSHADDVVYMGPDGRILLGWDQVRTSWQKQAEMNLRGEVAPAATRIILGADLALVCSRLRGHNLDAAGTRQEVSIRESHLYRKEDGAWKMVSLHADILPFVG